MIKDKEIDLTVNSKFDGREERNFQYRVKSCMEKLGIENRVRLSIVEEVTAMPWDTREIHSQNDLYRSENRVSRIDDMLSNEVGIPLRITSTNEIIVLGDTDYDEDYLEMLLLETVGIVPYTSWNRCFSCGEYTLTPKKGLDLLCEKCRNEIIAAIPWERRRGVGLL